MNIDISLRVASWQPTVPIHYVQYSTEIPIVFHIEDYEIPEGAEARFYLKKPSGAEIYNNCEISGNTVTLKPTAQTFAEDGKQFGQLQIVISEDKLVTFILTFLIEENLITDSALPSSDEFGVLDTLIDEANQAIKDAQDAIEDAQALANYEYVESTMYQTGWSGNQYSFETTYPNTQYDIEIFPNNTCTEDQIDAWGSALITGSATTNIATALGDVPTVDIPIIIQVRKKVSE